jgi:hypothetical protein
MPPLGAEDMHAVPRAQDDERAPAFIPQHSLFGGGLRVVPGLGSGSLIPPPFPHHVGRPPPALPPDALQPSGKFPQDAQSPLCHHGRHPFALPDSTPPGRLGGQLLDPPAGLGDEICHAAVVRAVVEDPQGGSAAPRRPQDVEIQSG